MRLPLGMHRQRRRHCYRCPVQLLALWCLLVTPSFAGPPYVTDDPEPVEYRHWEIYLASLLARDAGAWSGTAPHVEVNYGAAPNLQLHTILPMSFVRSTEGAMSY